MAKLVAVCRDEADFVFQRRQIPLNIEDTLTVLYIVILPSYFLGRIIHFREALSSVCSVPSFRLDGHGNSRNFDFHPSSQ